MQGLASLKGKGYEGREGLLGFNNNGDCVRMSLINEEECMRIRSSFACGGIKANRRFD